MGRETFITVAECELGNVLILNHYGFYKQVGRLVVGNHQPFIHPMVG